ncbi:haloacid dehalogenase-like hydrolase [Lacticaseibacillus absianus]|uniref:DUF7916 family protein n=1 Tax=Lacticaseibacillus absianus TaxID=2729623 RepID=UPI0015CB7DE0|nr:haloacid dehalogenase-like hydrolase [Lacticaseibacillus absianus]
MVVKRLLNCTASDFAQFGRAELVASIAASAGRTILAENDVALDPMTKNITNAEYVAAFGTDLILLNLFDFGTRAIKGLPASDDPIRLLKKLTGRPIGVNLEPVDPDATLSETTKAISSGRIASATNLKLASTLGFDFICLTGNPSTGVSNREITAAVRLAKRHFNGMIIAGKMHGAGVSEPVIDHQIASDYIAAGADVILIPVAGTIPGLSELEMSEMVHFVHEQDRLVMGAIGTTQEGADVGTIRALALTSKRAGCDIHHIGDGGFSGHADPENILQLSIAVRGKRHTFHRMALSVER